MPRKTIRLAKLTRPKLHNVLARHRLFAQLDAGRERAVVWVVGPPGSGKTALVASYVDATSVRCVWYHVDGGDHEPATFFHYLSQCIDTTSRQAPLPRITPEYLADLPAFTRYYFRGFFARLKTPAVLVFDNYQDIPAQSAMHAVLEHAAVESPEGIGLVFISREDPPPEYARLDASDRLARIEWNDLRLTLPEAAAIAALRFDLDAATLRTLYEASNGWAAGLTLALEQMKRSDGPAHTLQGAALESVFNYFAGQILNTAEPAVREFLLRTALFARAARSGCATPPSRGHPGRRPAPRRGVRAVPQRRRLAVGHPPRTGSSPDPDRARAQRDAARMGGRASRRVRRTRALVELLARHFVAGVRAGSGHRPPGARQHGDGARRPRSRRRPRHAARTIGDEPKPMEGRR